MYTNVKCIFYHKSYHEKLIDLNYWKLKIYFIFTHIHYKLSYNSTEIIIDMYNTSTLIKYGGN